MSNNKCVLGNNNRQRIDHLEKGRDGLRDAIEKVEKRDNTHHRLVSQKLENIDEEVDEVKLHMKGTNTTQAAIIAGLTIVGNGIMIPIVLYVLKGYLGG